MSALLVPPLPGEWGVDPYTDDQIFAFKCKCHPKCHEVYVGRTNQKFDLSNIQTVDELVILFETGTHIKLDVPLSVAATKSHSPAVFEAENHARRISEAVKLYNFVNFE